MSAGLEALESYSTLSLDAELRTGDDGYSLADTLGGPTPPSTSSSTASPPGRACGAPERERAILYMRFFEDMTQSRIADQLGISQMHVSPAHQRSCARVRQEAMDIDRDRDASES